MNQIPDILDPFVHFIKLINKDTIEKFIIFTYLENLKKKEIKIKIAHAHHYILKKG